MTTELRTFLEVLPKIELHSHLNGCVRESTLLDLASTRKIRLSSHHFGATSVPADNHLHNSRPRSLNDCFDFFTEISRCVDDLEALRRITREALDDFASHFVCYLELRSTPKRLKRQWNKPELATKQDYVETILQVFSKFDDEETRRYELQVKSGVTLSRPPLIPRFIVSVDRANTIHEAVENVDLAIQLFESDDNKYIVGMDLGGNPTKNNFRDFQPILQRARAAGLKITIHCGEVPCDDGYGSTFQEFKAILDFVPDRLGHALLLPTSLRSTLDTLRIPVESCPTSNVMTLELATYVHGHIVKGLQRHPQLGHWLETGYPISISTDDCGVFHTNPTKELLLLALAWEVDQATLRQIQINSVNDCFCSDEIKARLLKVFER